MPPEISEKTARIWKIRHWFRVIPNQWATNRKKQNEISEEQKTDETAIPNLEGGESAEITSDTEMQVSSAVNKVHRPHDI